KVGSGLSSPFQAFVYHRPHDLVVIADRKNRVGNHPVGDLASKTEIQSVNTREIDWWRGDRLAIIISIVAAGWKVYLEELPVVLIPSFARLHQSANDLDDLARHLRRLGHLHAHLRPHLTLCLRPHAEDKAPTGY